MIRGSKALAEKLGVSQVTVWHWRKIGVIMPAIVSEFGRVIIYDLEKVYKCLNYQAPSKRKYNT